MNEYEILAQFRAAAEKRGLRPPNRLEADGKLRRCELQVGPKGKKDGAYLLHLDGVPAGGYENHRDGLGWMTWKADIGRELSAEEEAAHRARMEAQRAEREAEAKAKRDKARRKANAIWNNAKPAPHDHPYLQRKGIPSFGLRVGAWPKWREVRPGEWREERIPNALLVPMRSPSGTLHSLQAIYAERVEGLEKCFLPNGEKSGKLHLIGELTERLPLCVAEGYATAATVYLATNWPVAVAFDAGSLEPVARALREAHPGTRFIICADDDHQTAGNPGRTKADAAARAVGGVVAVPEFGPDRPDHATDFNDLHALAGLDAVRLILESARAALDANSGPVDDETPPAAPSPAPEAETPSSSPETAPAAPSDEPEKPTKRTRSKTKGKAPGVQTRAQGGEVFELRDGADGRGVYRLKVERRGEGWETVEQFVCAPFEITHQVRDARGENWQRLATFNDHDGRQRRLLVPDDMLEGDGAALARLLRAQGLHIGDNRGGLLKMYVNRSRPSARARLTTRIGWHDDVSEPGRWSFVLVDADPLAAPGAELWLHQAQGSGHAQFKSAGTLADWRDNVAALAVGNSRAVFALSAGFAGGLCWLHPNISGGFHWSGSSSLGKSSLLYAAASLCGPASYCRTWLLTATAIEGVAAGHCDAPLLLDELKQAGNPKDVAQAAYMLTSGQGKGRGQAAGGLRETASFSLLFQSNGEIGLTQFLEENQERAYAGQEVRFCELPADAGAGFGCWDVLHGLPDGARFSETLQRNAAKHYGTAYPEFIRNVIRERDALPRQFEELRAAFEKRALSDKAGGQAIRAATRFAAVAYAGEKSTEWGLTGWPQGEAVKACMRMFKDWLHAFGGEENREPRKMVQQVQAWIQAHAGARLEDWRRPSVVDSHAPRTMNRAGWKRPTAETTDFEEKYQVFEYLIYPAVFKSELCNGFDPAQVTKELLKAGVLERGDGKNIPVKVREPGAGVQSRLYCIKPDLLGWSADHD